MRHNEVTPAMKGFTARSRDRVSLRTVLPLVAVGTGLAAAPAGALELGQLTVESKLGQPLRASIAYALAPNELLSGTCVSVSAGRTTGGLPGIGKNTVQVTPSAIVITGDGATREPMLGTRVTIVCPSTANISRDYMLFVDPAGVVEKQDAAVTTTAMPTPRRQTEPKAASETRTSSRTVSKDTPIGQAARYRVQPGDNLYDIARRIENRSMALSTAIDRIFEANPNAFVGNDPDKLKAGSWLTIPSLEGSAPAVDAPRPSAAPVAVEPPVESFTKAVVTLDNTTDAQPRNEATEGPSTTRPETIDIPDTSVEEPVTTSSSPNVPTAIISTGSRSESTSTLMWLAGIGLGIIAVLLLYGRRFRDRFSRPPVGASAPGASAGTASALEATDVFAHCDIADDAPTQENPVLDADLGNGTGLKDTGEIDIVQDFGFSTTTELDIELPFEHTGPVKGGDTDIIAPLTRDLESILDSEVLPEDDDYDMSIIRDVTKMPQPEDVTEHDLQAIEVDASGDDEDDTNVTISQDADYDLLEQDYEEELSATQMLNIEIERAAAKLAQDLDEKVADDHTKPSAEISGTFETDFELDDTTAVTVDMSREEKTAEMPVANDDESVEPDVTSGTAETGRRKSTA
jgi:hypothetical protein